MKNSSAPDRIRPKTPPPLAAWPPLDDFSRQLRKLRGEGQGSGVRIRFRTSLAGGRARRSARADAPNRIIIPGRSQVPVAGLDHFRECGYLSSMKADTLDKPAIAPPARRSTYQRSRRRCGSPLKTCELWDGERACLGACFISRKSRSIHRALHDWVMSRNAGKVVSAPLTWSCPHRTTRRTSLMSPKTGSKSSERAIMVRRLGG